MYCLSVGCAVLAITTGNKKVPVICLAGVSVFGSGGKLAVFLLWRENFITNRKKKDTIVIFVLVQLELNLIQIH